MDAMNCAHTNHYFFDTHRTPSDTLQYVYIAILYTSIELSTKIRVIRVICVQKNLFHPHLSEIF
jgi:hypothetical protein